MDTPLLTRIMFRDTESKILELDFLSIKSNDKSF